MMVCDKCRCREVCGLKDLYLRDLEVLRETYKPTSGNFEAAIRCTKYIPDKKKMEAVNGSNKNRD